MGLQIKVPSGTGSSGYRQKLQMFFSPNRASPDNSLIGSRAAAQGATATGWVQGIGDLSLQTFIELDVHLKPAVQFAVNRVLRAQALQQMEQFVARVDQAAAHGWASSAAVDVLKADATELSRVWVED
jgi:hypothetical protein